MHANGPSEATGTITKDNTSPVILQTADNDLVSFILSNNIALWIIMSDYCKKGWLVPLIGLSLHTIPHSGISSPDYSVIVLDMSFKTNGVCLKYLRICRKIN